VFRWANEMGGRRTRSILAVKGGGPSQGNRPPLLRGKPASVAGGLPNSVAGNLHPRSPGKGTNDPDPWWCGRARGAPIAVQLAAHGRCHRHCHGKAATMRRISTSPRSRPGPSIIERAQFEKVFCEEKVDVGLRLDRWPIRRKRSFLVPEGRAAVLVSPPLKPVPQEEIERHPCVGAR